MKTWRPDEALKAIPGLKPAQEKINGSIKAIVLATVEIAAPNSPSR